jgi:hypothetical protein
MAVQDDVRRLSQLDSIYLGWTTQNSIGSPITSWYKGRVQQANDGTWVFRSISLDGTLIGFQLGVIYTNWTSMETPSVGITVQIGVVVQGIPGNPGSFVVILQQQLPQELTN